MTLPIIAGSMSTVIFVVSYLPMLVKAVRTRDLSSYSLGSMVLANAGSRAVSPSWSVADGSDSSRSSTGGTRSIRCQRASAAASVARP